MYAIRSYYGANPIQTLLTVSAWVWAAGAVILFAYALISYFIMKYRMRSAVKIDGVYESA